MTFDPRRLHTFRNSSATKQAQALFILSPPSVYRHSYLKPAQSDDVAFGKRRSWS